MKSNFISLILFFFLPFSANAQIISGAEVAVTSTESGEVRGFIQDGIYTYKGIPYAQAERFEAPQKVSPWDGVRSSTSWGPVCPLLTPTTSVNDEMEFFFDHDWGYPNEDCLVLNVWTPGIKDNKKRPVLFWIHGGGYWAGSSQELKSYHGENLARKGDVVVVSVNHRLNVLGFLDLSAYGEQYKHSANHSLLDLRVALEWVQENISNFGGDPDNVMIFGQSGGGAKVNNLMSMPSAQGLFHKAVNQSGAFRGEILEQEVTREIAAETLKELGITDKEVDKIKEIPFEELAAAGTKALKTVENRMKEKNFGFTGLNWGPGVDGDLMPYQTFSKEAMELSKSVPLLIGTVKNEFMPSLFSGLTHGSMEQVKGFLQNQHGDQTEAFIAAAKKVYPDYQKPSDLMDIDQLFRPGAVHQANLKSALSGGAPVYMYLFAWESPVMDGKFKAFHCIELPFVFDNIDRCAQMTGGGRGAQILADKVSQAWINFARSGNPNHAGLPKWAPYSSKNGTTLFFDDYCKIQHHHDREFLEFNK